ncbi:DUF4149 domain-containing protein [Nitrospira moscoviensis]|uniref:TMEM205-like domain-containing protein n=1 Tax=Nitrospira moscoviensis TaxID=42253 RepID=A0A0K2G6M3_NITMO|nr:DUF4149 domain-containing protein [Nitrospira moscoviensis]ALA56580.1 conserved membrane protein of unknown function [Nitrospira moscoviensis]
MRLVMEYLSVLAAAVLIGKVVLLSFVVAPVLAKNLDQEAFGKVVRHLFPAYYALGIGAACTGLASVIMRGITEETDALHHLAAGLWLVVMAAETYCRSPLTPQSNAMRDRLKEQESRGAVDPVLQRAWNRLHQRSVYLNALVLCVGLGLLGLANR